MCIKIKQLGLDFGSSATSVVGIAEGCDRPILFDSGDDGCFFTAIAKLISEEKYLYFRDALRVGKDGEYDFYSAFKENIGEEKELAKRYLTEVFQRVKNTDGYDFSELERICYGYPKYATEKRVKEYCEIMDIILLNIVEEVFGKDPNEKMVVISHGEPMLALAAYKWVKEKYSVKSAPYCKKDDVLLVLDFGGHTLDMALAKIDDDGAIAPIKHTSHEISLSGTGKKINGLISKKAKTSDSDSGIESAKRELFDDPTRCTEFHKLEYRPGYMISLAYDESKHDIIARLKKDDSITELNIYTGDVYSEAKESIIRFLKDAKKLKGRINRVLFTGGTSRISYLRYTVLNSIKEQKWLSPDYNVNRVDDQSEVSLFVTASSGARSKGDEMKPLSAETSVALGAALAASNPSLFKSESVRIAAPAKKSGLTPLQSRQIKLAIMKLKKIKDRDIAIREVITLLENLPEN